MFLSSIYITLELVLVLVVIAGLYNYSRLLKLRHLLMTGFLFYIFFLASKINLLPLGKVFGWMEHNTIIFYCLLPSVIVSQIIEEIHKTNPKFLVDTTKIINLPGFPKIAPLILYPLLSVPLQEIIFRWFYVGRLESASLPMMLTLLISSLVFGIVHLPFGSKSLFIGTFLAGIWWGALYIMTGNLWYPIISHAILGEMLIWLALFKTEKISNPTPRSDGHRTVPLP